MTITYHREMVQGSEEWAAARCGILTASEMKLILTPSLKQANNEKEKGHLFELLAQRITRYVEPQYISSDMLRGVDDEIEARALYAQHYAPVMEAGFVTNDEWGFTIGYSPDGLVGEDGLIECKSRRQKYQVQTIVTGEMPDDYLMQVQTGLLVTGRKWIDFISYSGGLPMCPIRVYPDARIQDAILTAAEAFEDRLTKAHAVYLHNVETKRLIATERKIEEEMYL